MSERLIYVSVELGEITYLVGRLWSHLSKGRERASFQYDKQWLLNENRFSLEPQLMLAEGTFHADVGKTLFGAIGDSAPDRWGRVLMRRAHFHRTKNHNETPHHLNEIDYLLGVNDEARIGALRFSRKIEGPYLAQTDTMPIPPLLALPKLLSASDHVGKHEDTSADLQLLLAPGSSLGGARPKASIKEKNGELAIAKFPRDEDEYSVVKWEAVALRLATLAGIHVPSFRIEQVGVRPVLIIERFDRKRQSRIPFISAMSMIGAEDNEQHSYLELVDALRQYGASAKEDIHALWTRVVFNILISNTDDHLRNHGFLYFSPRGWSLSPLYDVNPTPLQIKPRILTTAIDMDNSEASLDLAFSVIKDFDIKLSEAKKIAKNVATAVSDWRKIAKEFGIPNNEVAYMSSAFEHEDLKQALSL